MGVGGPICPARGETIAAAYPDFPRHFGFFLPPAGISTVKEIKNNPIDVKATGRLNRLYVELPKDNPERAGADIRSWADVFPYVDHVPGRGVNLLSPDVAPLVVQGRIRRSVLDSA
jgi:hypothetical protein